VYGGRLAAMAARYANLGETLGDAALVKKLLDTVPDRLFPVVAGIEQFHDVTTMAFDEALGRLRAFDERVRRRGQDGGGRGGEQLLMTAAQWAARESTRRCSGRRRRAQRGVGERRQQAQALLQVRGARALPARVPAAAERTGGGAGSLGRCQRRRRRTPLGRGLGCVCWNKPRRVWSGSSGASGARGTGGTYWCRRARRVCRACR